MGSPGLALPALILGYPEGLSWITLRCIGWIIGNLRWEGGIYEGGSGRREVLLRLPISSLVWNLLFFSSP